MSTCDDGCAEQGQIDGLTQERDEALAEVSRLRQELDEARAERDVARSVLATAREDPDWDPGAMVMLYDRAVDRADAAEGERDRMRPVVEAAEALVAYWKKTFQEPMNPLVAAVDAYQSATPDAEPAPGVWTMPEIPDGVRRVRGRHDRLYERREGEPGWNRIDLPGARPAPVPYNDGELIVWCGPLIDATAEPAAVAVQVLLGRFLASARQARGDRGERTAGMTPDIPDAVYEAAAKAYDEAASAVHVHWAQGIRAALDAVWPLAFDAGRAQAAADILGVLRNDDLYQEWNRRWGLDPAGPRSYVPAEQRDVMHDFAEWAIAAGGETR